MHYLLSIKTCSSICLHVTLISGNLFTAELPKDPCYPNPCGLNAQCNNGICTCIAEYHGDPYRECRPECVLNSDCSRDKACINQKCKDPCPGLCGQNADCTVFNHYASCNCIQGFSGDPFVICSKVQGKYLYRFTKKSLVRNNLFFYAEPPIKHPCNPTPCGPNSQCREFNGQAICSCLQGYIGSPPACRPECVSSSDCLLNRACINQKCIDPCPGTCGLNALCQVINHNAICSCPPRYSGDPFIRCQAVIGKANLLICPNNEITNFIIWAKHTVNNLINIHIDCLLLCS